ncbi:MAG: DUF262 domain-containing protein [Planctomycetia bacterium]|nr:DUF262 domain-containing protein [Planctomycetia bacterium]
MEKPLTSTYRPSDFLNWRSNSQLNLTPKFQRRGVWKSDARAYFIDTLLREMPVPPIYIRMVQSAELTDVIHEVIDGQQRISAVLDFLDNKYALSESLGAPWGGKTFKELSGAEKLRLKAYPFNAQVFSSASDVEILELFARLNTYSVPLNSQELRNGRFFGLFKQSVYSLGHEHLEFWRSNRIFTEQGIARMLEAELVSELLVAQLHGMQDKKKSLDEYYDKYDKDFKAQTKTCTRFKKCIDAITETFSDTLSSSEFRRPPLFYTLYCVVRHRLFSLPKALPRSPKRMLTNSERTSLVDAANTLSEQITRDREDQRVASQFQEFVRACTQQTDNIGPRTVRFETLYKLAF